MKRKVPLALAAGGLGLAALYFSQRQSASSDSYQPITVINQSFDFTGDGRRDYLALEPLEDGSALRIGSYDGKKVKQRDNAYFASPLNFKQLSVRLGIQEVSEYEGETKRGRYPIALLDATPLIAPGTIVRNARLVQGLDAEEGQSCSLELDLTSPVGNNHSYLLMGLTETENLGYSPETKVLMAPAYSRGEKP